MKQEIFEACGGPRGTGKKTEKNYIEFKVRET